MVNLYVLYSFFFQKLQMNSSSVYYNNVSTLPLTNNYTNSINNSNNMHHVQHKNLLFETVDGSFNCNSIATTSKDFTTLVTTNAMANSSPATSLMSMSLSSATTIPSSHHHTLGGSVGINSGMTMSGGHITVGGSDLDLNINAIKDRLMTTRVPESCV